MKVRKKKKEYKIGYFLTILSKVVSVNSDGNLTYSGFETNELIRTLKYLLEFTTSAEHLDKSKLITKALKDSILTNDFTETSFLKFIENHTKTELRKKEETYYILTTTSLNCSELTKKEYNILNCKISFKQNFSEIFSSRQVIFDKFYSQLEISQDILTYSAVEIEVKSRSKEEAFSRALDALSIIRALMNLQLNSVSIIMGDFQKPINKVLLGKLHTIHNESGEVFQYPVYYEPEYKPAESIHPKKPEIFEKNISVMLERAEQCKFSKKIMSALIRFVDAMDRRDKNISVIKLWAILESIVGEGSCDKLEYRICALSNEREVTKHIVMHIREYRNEHVHQGIKDDDSIHRAYYLQRFFDQIIFFYTHPANSFTSLTQANAVLDGIALGEVTLNEKIDNLQRALSIYKQIEERYSASQE